MAFEIPEACTLPTEERPFRLAEFDALLATAVSAERDVENRLTLHFIGGDELHATLRDLTTRESECCSFFEFTVARAGLEVILGVGVPAQHTGILDSLEGRVGQPA